MPERPRYYKLQGHIAIPCEWFEWAVFFETADRHVRRTHIGPLTISTVFLGLDHNSLRKGDPLLFETMIFGDDYDGYQTRCGTWTEAEDMHDLAFQVAEAWVRRAEPTIQALNAINIKKAGT